MCYVIDLKQNQYIYPKSKEMGDTNLTTHRLLKDYKQIRALNGLSLEVKKGQVFGILGPNGSGKTTTLGILLGALKATSGNFSWFDNGEQDENRLRIGALLETPNFYPYLNAVENLKIVAQIKRMPNPEQRIDEVLRMVHLLERKTSPFKTYSLGMKQRLAIASALLNDPEILVLDEPTNGLDPEGIAEIRALIKTISTQGKTIVIASHLLDEIEKVCTHVAILRKGELLKIGTLAEIMTNDRFLLLSAENIEQLVTAIQGVEGVEFVRHEKEEMILVKVDASVHAGKLNATLFAKGIHLSVLKPHQQSLEETFLEIVKS